MSFMDGKYVSGHNEMPTDPHWAIITYETRYIPGDERSRTNPGHGYPEHTETYVSYRAFTDQDKWEKEVAELTTPKFGSPRPFMAAYVIPAKVTTSVKVSVNVDVPKY